MKRLILFFFSALFCTAVSAHDFVVDGIYYYITSNSDLTVRVTYRGDYTYSYSNEYTGSVVIPEKITYDSKEYSVTSIGNSAFYDCKGLTSVTIPNSVTSIVDEAFCKCSGLKSVTIGNSVTSIGNHAFRNCSGLTRVDIPNSVTSIGNYVFDGCYALTSVTIGNSVTSIGTWAFSGCSSLTAVHITDLSAWCKIKFADLYSNPTVYANHLYLNGEEVKNLVIPDDVTTIGEYAFRKCSSLTSVTIPNYITSVGFEAFDGCKSLKTVYISDLSAWCKINFDGRTSNPTYYAKHLYLNDEEITNLIIPDDVTNIGKYAFCNCTSISNITIPNSVIEIGKGSFRYCSGLTNITIPDSVTHIMDFAFEECSSLTNITIPNSVENIGDYAFAGCNNITRIDCMATTPPIVYNKTFSNEIYTKATLNVLEGCVEAYKSADVWKEFTNISVLGASTGIKQIESAAASSYIYDINGNRIGKNCDEINNLKRGIYITGGKKVYIR